MPITINDCECGRTPEIKVTEAWDEFEFYISCLCGKESGTSYSSEKAIRRWNEDNPSNSMGREVKDVYNDK